MSKKPEFMKCVNCFYYDAPACHRFPPNFTPTNYEQRYPAVSEDDWCGEFNPVDPKPLSLPAGLKFKTD